MVFEPQAATQVVVNEAMATLLWPTGDPLGQCIYFRERNAPCHRVVGVVETARRDKLIEEPAPQSYLPLGAPVTSTWGGTTLVVRVARGVERAVREDMTTLLRRTFPGAEPRIRAMTENLEPQYRPWRLGATLFTALGFLALVVAVLGVYGTISYTVGQRMHEFGVRIALGARVRDVLTLVVGEGLRVIGIGVLLGVVLVLAAGRLIEALLYGVEPGNPAVILAASAALLFAAGVAALLPAWRGARVDPCTALRDS